MARAAAEAAIRALARGKGLSWRWKEAPPAVGAGVGVGKRLLRGGKGVEAAADMPPPLLLDDEKGALRESRGPGCCWGRESKGSAALCS